MPKMLAVQVREAKGPFELVEREVPEAGPGQVRIKVQACGVCHSDVVTKEGLMPGIRYPRAPGHEVAGVVDAIGPGVEGWSAGQRAGVGWHGGHCGYCDSCRRGDFVTCQVAFQVPGINYDGGYAEYLIAPACGGSPRTARSSRDYVGRAGLEQEIVAVRPGGAGCRNGGECST